MDEVTTLYLAHQNDTIQAKLNSNFDVKIPIIQFHIIEHNFIPYYWIKLKLYQRIQKVFLYVGVK